MCLNSGVSWMEREMARGIQIARREGAGRKVWGTDSGLHFGATSDTEPYRTTRSSKLTVGSFSLLSMTWQASFQLRKDAHVHNL